MRNDLSQRQLDAEMRLARALAPTTPEEVRTVAWLQGWEIETMDRISAMAERNVPTALVGRLESQVLLARSFLIGADERDVLEARRFLDEAMKLIKLLSEHAQL